MIEFMTFSVVSDPAAATMYPVVVACAGGAPLSNVMVATLSADPTITLRRKRDRIKVSALSIDRFVLVSVARLVPARLDPLCHARYGHWGGVAITSPTVPLKWGERTE
jgi:hypothetical protein